MTLRIVLLVLVAAGAIICILCKKLRTARRVAAASQRRAELSESRFSGSFHTSPIPLALTSVETDKLIEVNSAYASMLGFERDELVGYSASELGIQSAETSKHLARRFRRSGVIRNFSTQARCKGGEQRDVVLALAPIAIDGQPHSLTTMIDQTEIKRTEAALYSTDERLRELADAVREVFWMASSDRSKLHYVSPGYETMFGRSCASLYADPRSWLDAVHPEDLELAQRSRGDDRDTSSADFRITRPDGAVRWIRNTTFISRDTRGRIIRVAGVCADITEQRELEVQLRQALKMESLGMLAGGVAHDFNNVLAVISACNSMLAETVPVTSPNRELVDDIEDAVGRAVGLTRQLLAFSRKQVTAPVVLDLNAIVGDTQKMLLRIIGEDIVLTAVLDPAARSVRADPGCLVQVLMNLVVNARDAMPDGGQLGLETRVVDVPRLGRAMMLAVSDTGCGMSAEVKARMFDPFFTTKEIGKGTGMGLAVVHGIVNEAGGYVEVDSEPGRGATFRVYLPIVDADPAQGVPVPVLASGTERILIVDDDMHVRRAAGRALHARGYIVSEAADGRAALCELAQREFDLLLTDVVMPGMDGRQLAEAACARDPKLVVLFMSGHTDDAVVRRGVRHGEVELIEKPFENQSLATRVRLVLDRSYSGQLRGSRVSLEERESAI